MIEWVNSKEVEYLSKKSKKSVFAYPFGWDDSVKKVRVNVWMESMDVTIFGDDRQLKTVTLFEWIDIIQNGPKIY